MTTGILAGATAARTSSHVPRLAGRHPDTQSHLTTLKLRQLGCDVHRLPDRVGSRSLRVCPYQVLPRLCSLTSHTIIELGQHRRYMNTSSLRGFLGTPARLLELKQARCQSTDSPIQYSISLLLEYLSTGNVWPRPFQLAYAKPSDPVLILGWSAYHPVSQSFCSCPPRLRRPDDRSELPALDPPLPTGRDIVQTQLRS